MVSVWLLFLRICRAPESILRSEHFAQSTTDIVVPYSIIDDKPHCTTMYMYPRDGSRSFQKGGRFISETIYYF